MLFPIVVACIGVFGVLAIILYSYHVAAKRRELMSGFARESGGQYMSNVFPEFARNFRNFYPFYRGAGFAEKYAPGLEETFGTLGSRDRIENMVAASRKGFDWYAFDYIYVTGSGKNRHTHFCGVVLARLPMNLPRINISGENFLTRIGSALGFADLQFEYEEFNKRYRVTAPEPKSAFEILCPEVMEYLMTIPVRNWQLDGSYIVVVEQNLLNPPGIEEIEGEIEQLVALIPTFVRQDRAIQQNWKNAFDGLVGLAGGF